LYREKLAQAGLVEALFNAFDASLKSRGYLAMGGHIVDASLVSAPVQRNSREENKAIKDGAPPVAWKPNKKAQKDVDAPFTARDIQQRDWAGLVDRGAIGVALDLLDATKHVRLVSGGPGPHGGRPSEAYTWHPALKGER